MSKPLNLSLFSTLEKGVLNMKRKSETIKPEDAVKKLRDIFIKLAEKQLELAKIMRWTEEVKGIEDPSDELKQEAQKKKQRVDALVKEIVGLGKEVGDLQQIYEEMSAKFDLKPKGVDYIK